MRLYSSRVVVCFFFLGSNFPWRHQLFKLLLLNWLLVCRSMSGWVPPMHHPILHCDKILFQGSWNVLASEIQDHHGSVCQKCSTFVQFRCTTVHTIESTMNVNVQGIVFDYYSHWSLLFESPQSEHQTPATCPLLPRWSAKTRCYLQPSITYFREVTHFPPFSHSWAEWRPLRFLNVNEAIWIHSHFTTGASEKRKGMCCVSPRLDSYASF